MSTFEANNADTEANGSGRNGSSRRHRRCRQLSMAASSETTTTDGSFHFTDSDSDQSWQSPLGSMAGESDGILVNCEAQRDNKQRGTFSKEEIDLECGELELLKLHDKEERDCRIFHLKSGGIGSGEEMRSKSLQEGWLLNWDVLAKVLLTSSVLRHVSTIPY
ncbi:hypothetical protein A4A49_22487 [Nicotiana attenuata]|uniref:Uncharacterized protein n=1 Tax=Nicotiana attenuata TaxID=49451 RepID=A0A314KTQ8_NICAT|nr:hypothetical protein A4A49_22487 [Nicotiana attenuata]